MQVTSQASFIEFRSAVSDEMQFETTVENGWMTDNRRTEDGQAWIL